MMLLSIRDRGMKQIGQSSVGGSGANKSAPSSSPSSFLASASSLFSISFGVMVRFLTFFFRHDNTTKLTAFYLSMLRLTPLSERIKHQSEPCAYSQLGIPSSGFFLSLIRIRFQWFCWTSSRPKMVAHLLALVSRRQ